MRILFAFAGGAGHFEPLVPIARAAESAGHVLAVAGRPDNAAAIDAAGLRMIPVGTRPRKPSPAPLLPVDREREEREFRDGFAGAIARKRADLLLDVYVAWRPDLVVCDETDFGAMVAAERLRIPYASVIVLVAGVLARPGPLVEPLNRLRAAHRLPPDPELAMLSRRLVLAPLPGRFRDPAHPLPATARCFRPFDVHRGPGEPPAWSTAVPGAPVVYFTLGTVFNVESGDLFDRVLAGLGELAVNVLATVGRQRDPAQFGPRPANVHIERYVPQEAVLPYCDVMVSHGGSGSVVGALAHGVPSVLIPIGADQPSNADRCEALGVARVLDALTVSPAEVAEAVSAVLNDPGYRAAARAFGAEMAAMPGPDHAVTLLESLATAA